MLSSGDVTPFLTVQGLPDYRFRIEFWAVVGCLVLFGLLLEFIRRHHLKERYSLLWFLTVGVLLTFTLKRDWLATVSGWLGIYYPPNALFLILVFFMLVILFHYSMVISGLLNDRKTLVQQIGLLEARLESLEREMKPSLSDEGEQTSNTGD